MDWANNMKSLVFAHFPLKPLSYPPVLPPHLPFHLLRDFIWNILADGLSLVLALLKIFYQILIAHELDFPFYEFHQPVHPWVLFVLRVYCYFAVTHLVCVGQDAVEVAHFVVPDSRAEAFEGELSLLKCDLFLV